MELCLICCATIVMCSPALNGRAYQDGIISRRDMPRAISEYLPVESEGSDDEVENHGGELGETPPGFRRVSYRRKF